MSRTLTTWRDCVRALLDEETLENLSGTRIMMYGCGNIFDQNGERFNTAFAYPHQWKIVEETVTITKAQLIAALNRRGSGLWHAANISEELGFKS